MAKKKHKRPSKIGLAPGSLIFTGERKVDEISIKLIRYNKEEIIEEPFNEIEKVIELAQDFQGISWINIEGLHEVGVIEKIGEKLGLHKLTLEDVLSVGQRPKIDEHDNYIYCVLKMFTVGGDHSGVESEQLSFILQGNTLITFQEKEGDVFEYVRIRLREGKGNIRGRKTDYLLYALIDAVVDHYYLIIENLGEQLEEVEITLFENPDKEILEKIHYLRREMLHLRRSVYPLREVISRLEKIEEPKVESGTKVFIRDLYDHTIQVIETIEVLRDMSSGMTDLYMSSVSNKMNNVMKILTIIATIFIPLTFIAGIYGMNFEYMPELTWRWGYFGILAIMLIIIVGMLAYFRKNKWI
nr:magnesium/cobalt transporter CorA [Saprospiraceae bacterium]